MIEIRGLTKTCGKTVVVDGVPDLLTPAAPETARVVGLVMPTMTTIDKTSIPDEIKLGHGAGSAELG